MLVEIKHGERGPTLRLISPPLTLSSAITHLHWAADLFLKPSSSHAAAQNRKPNAFYPKKTRFYGGRHTKLKRRPAATVQTPRWSRDARFKCRVGR